MNKKFPVKGKDFLSIKNYFRSIFLNYFKVNRYQVITNGLFLHINGSMWEVSNIFLQIP